MTDFTATGTYTVEAYNEETRMSDLPIFNSLVAVGTVGVAIFMYGGVSSLMENAGRDAELEHSKRAMAIGFFVTAAFFIPAVAIKAFAG